jgi:hypothetical protein
MLLQDISKAYDSVARYIGKEMSLRRLGMPDDLIDTYLQMDVGNRCAVVTAYGYSDEILGTEEGSFEFERGWCQGASESPDGWVAFYDILIAMQNDGERVQEEVVRCCGEPLPGAAYADDAAWMATGPRGLELRLNVSMMFFDFAEIQFNPKKSHVLASRWAADEHGESAMHDVADGAEDERWIPRLYDAEELFAGGRLNVLPAAESPEHLLPERAATGTIRVLPLAEGERYLGVCFSPRLDTAVTEEQIRAIVETAAWNITASKLTGDAAGFMTDDVLWARVGFRLRFERLAPDKVTSLEWIIRKVFLRCNKLAVNTNKDVVYGEAKLGGLGWTSWYDRIMTDRLAGADHSTP